MIKNIFVKKNIVHFEIVKVFSINSLTENLNEDAIFRLYFSERDDDVFIDNYIEIPSYLITSYLINGGVNGEIFVDDITIKISPNTISVSYDYTKRINWYKLRKYAKKNLIDNDTIVKNIMVNSTKCKIKFKSAIFISSKLFIDVLNKYKGGCL